MNPARIHSPDPLLQTVFIRENIQQRPPRATRLCAKHRASAKQKCGERIRTPLAEYGDNPERKNTPCISDLAGVKFLLKKESVFFFRGSALQVFGRAECVCNSDSFLRNYFPGGMCVGGSILFFVLVKIKKIPHIQILVKQKHEIDLCLTNSIVRTHILLSCQTYFFTSSSFFSLSSSASNIAINSIV